MYSSGNDTLLIVGITSLLLGLVLIGAFLLISSGGSNDDNDF